MNRKLSRLTPHPTGPPPKPLTMKLPNTSIRMWPAIIATKSRSARLNGRTMNEMNSMAAISGTMTAGVPCGMNREKKCRPWRQKPTISTMAKLITASTPVMLKWLVVVKACLPGITASRGGRGAGAAGRQHSGSAPQSERAGDAEMAGGRKGVHARDHRERQQTEQVGDQDEGEQR